MIEVIEKAEPEIKYPVGRKWKADGTVAIFWNEFQATRISGCSLTGHTRLLKSCMRYVDWIPADLEISDGCIILDGGKLVKEEIIYPVARRRKNDGLLVIYTAYKAGVVADVGRVKKKNVSRGCCARSYWDEAMESTDSNWESANLKIYG